MASIFSRIISGEIPCYKLAEDESHIAFLDITPVAFGHTLVVPKREVDYYFDLSAEELGAINGFAKMVAAKIKKAVPCRRIGVAIIGLEVPHAHIHLVPLNTMKDINFSGERLKFTTTEMLELAEKISKTE
jgi:histidine triad (HIT) family protein